MILAVTIYRELRLLESVLSTIRLEGHVLIYRLVAALHRAELLLTSRLRAIQREIVAVIRFHQCTILEL